ncbi:MAG: DUF779 domain-containing protein [Bacteroidetes bacterium]|nr:DUF779 domain-containing protein [Bacteroidota bacterium]
MISRISCSSEVAGFIAELKNQFGELMFHQSGGCCDGSQPMCFEKGDFKIGSSDVCLGSIENCDFWMSKDQFEYWKFTQLHVVLVHGRGSSFSLEIPYGKRFMVQSRFFTKDELENLEPLRYAEN